MNIGKRKARERYKAYRKNKYGRLKKIFIMIIALCLVAMVVLLFRWKNQEIESTIEYEEGQLYIEKSGSDTETVTTEDPDDETEVSTEEDAISETVNAYLEAMNLEARIGQLFMTTPEELTGVGIVVQAGETTKQMLKEYAVGGLLFGEQNFEVIDQMKLMLTSIEVYTSTPIFLAMDESGSTRITNTKNTLSDVGFNMQYLESELYFVKQEEAQLISDYLQVVIIEEQDIVEVIRDGGELLVVEDNFKDFYDEVLAAVRSGELDESIIEERARAILTYKVENNI